MYIVRWQSLNGKGGSKIEQTLAKAREGKGKCIAVNAAHGNPVQRLVIENEDGLVIDEYAVPVAR